MRGRAASASLPGAPGGPRLPTEPAILDLARLRAADAEGFRRADPYPWVNPEGLLTAEGHRALQEALPDPDLFTASFGKARAHGQRSHDRFVLEYRDDLPVAPIWHAFVRELRAPAYGDFLRRLLGVRALRLTFHWHYTPRGCSVSPHCDARHKLGSHIFYFNTEKDWDAAWGGETVVLDDAGRFGRRSAPDFSDFARVIPAQALGNRSLLFARTDRSWHGVREITCPEGRLRKVFIVVIHRHGPRERLRQALGLRLPGY